MAEPYATRLISSNGAEKCSKLKRDDLTPAEPLRLLRHYGRGAEN